MDLTIKFLEIIVACLLGALVICYILPKKSESSEDVTSKKARQYLLDKYKAEMKQNHPEIDFNNSEDTVDFCLKLQSMDDDALEMAYRDIDFILRNALNLCFNDKTSIHPLKNGIGFLGWNYYLLKTGRVLKKRKKDAKDRAKKKVKLAIYLYEENIIDARSYGNRITSVLATLKKGDAGAFQRTLIHMQSA